MNWQSYEEVTKYIYETLGKSARVKIECHGVNCKVLGKSGVSHQIDVLTNHSDGIHTYKTAIECKFWESKVQKDTVAKLAEILEDAQIEKGVIVSQSGFTPDAISFAKYKNVNLVELREPTDDDWQGRIKDILVDIVMPIPHIEEFQFIQNIESQNPSEQLYGLSSDIVIVKPNGSFEMVHQLLERKMANSKWHEQDLTICEEKYPKGSYFEIQGDEKRRSFEGITFNIRRTEITQKIEIRGKDYVAMIMQSLFDNKRFTISKDGEIRESE